MKTYEIYTREDCEDCKNVIKFFEENDFSFIEYNVAEPKGFKKSIDNDIYKLPTILVYECIDRLYTIEEVINLNNNIQRVYSVCVEGVEKHKKLTREEALIKYTYYKTNDYMNIVVKSWSSKNDYKTHKKGGKREHFLE